MNELQTIDSPSADVIVVATNQEQMKQAQAQLVYWTNGRIAGLEKDLAAARVNLGIAQSSGWDVRGLKALAAKHERMVEFYEKVRGALEAGYTLVPNMEMDVIAVRIKRAAPHHKQTTAWRTPDVAHQALPAGEGRYVSNRAQEDEQRVEWKDDKGQQRAITGRWAEEYKDVDFPFRLARPEVLTEAAMAMALKVFDEIGVVPATQKGDPMVIGRMRVSKSWRAPSVSFLIAWFVDTRDLP